MIVEMLYRWLYTLYGSDFLMSKTSFGKDYGEAEEEEAEPPPDVTGGGVSEEIVARMPSSHALSAGCLGSVPVSYLGNHGMVL